MLNGKTAKIRKKWRWLVMVLGGVFRVQCIFPYIEGEAVLNVRTVKIYGKNIRKN